MCFHPTVCRFRSCHWINLRPCSCALWINIATNTSCSLEFTLKVSQEDKNVLFWLHFYLLSLSSQQVDRYLWIIKVSKAPKLSSYLWSQFLMQSLWSICIYSVFTGRQLYYLLRTLVWGLEDSWKIVLLVKCWCNTFCSSWI